MFRTYQLMCVVFPQKLLGRLLWKNLLPCQIQISGYSSQVQLHRERIRKQFENEIVDILHRNSDKMDELASLLSCKHEYVVKLAKSDTRILEGFEFNKVKFTIKLLLENGFSAKSIITYPPVFSKNINSLQLRLMMLQKVRKYSYKMSYLVCGEKQFQKLLPQLKQEVMLMGAHQSRESYLATLLKCDIEMVHYFLSEGHSYLHLRTLSALTSQVNELLKYSFSLDDIKQDIRVMKAKYYNLKSRLKILQPLEIPVRDQVYYLLLSSVAFTKRIRFFARDKEAINGFENKFEYLKSRLSCSDDELSAFLKKAPVVTRFRPYRMKTVLDVLINELKLSPKMILASHHLIFYSTERLRARYQILENFPISQKKIVSDLCLSEKEFQRKYG